MVEPIILPVYSKAFYDGDRFLFLERNIHNDPRKRLNQQHHAVSLKYSSKLPKPKLQNQSSFHKKADSISVQDNALMTNYRQSNDSVNWFLPQNVSCINDPFWQIISNRYVWCFRLRYKLYVRQIQPKIHETDSCAFPI
ncbi:hypothetical protein D3C72_1502560 [compost metagenome]